MPIPSLNLNALNKFKNLKNELDNLAKFDQEGIIDHPEHQLKRIKIQYGELYKAYALVSGAVDDINPDNNKHQHLLNLAHYSCTNANLYTFDEHETKDYLIMMNRAGLRHNEQLKLNGIFSKYIGGGLSLASALGIGGDFTSVASLAFDQYCSCFDKNEFIGVSSDHLKLFREQLFTENVVADLFRSDLRFSADGQQHLLGSALNHQIDTRMQQVREFITFQNGVSQQQKRQLFEQKINALRNVVSFAAVASDLFFRDSVQAKRIITIGGAAVTMISAFGEIASGAVSGWALGGPYVAAATAILSVISVIRNRSNSNTEPGLQHIMQHLCAMQKTILKGFRGINHRLDIMQLETTQNFERLHMVVSEGFASLEDFLTNGIDKLEYNQNQIKQTLQAIRVDLGKLQHDVRILFIQDVQFNIYLANKLDDTHYATMSAFYLVENNKIMEKLREIEQQLASPNIFLGKDKKDDVKLFNKLCSIVTLDASNELVTGAHAPVDALDNTLREQTNSNSDTRIRNAAHNIGLIFNALGIAEKASNCLIWTRGVELLLIFMFLNKAGIGTDVKRIASLQQEVKAINQNAKSQQIALKDLIDKIPRLREVYSDSIEKLKTEMLKDAKECQHDEINKLIMAEIEQNNRKILAIKGNDFAQNQKLNELQKKMLESKQELELMKVEQSKWLGQSQANQADVVMHQHKIDALEEENEHSKEKNRNCKDHHAHAHTKKAKRRRKERREDIDKKNNRIKRHKKEIENDQKENKQLMKQLNDHSLADEYEKRIKKLEKEKQKEIEKLEEAIHRLMASDDAILKIVLNKMEHAKPGVLSHTISETFILNGSNIVKNLFHLKKHIIKNYLLLSAVLAICFPEELQNNKFKDFLSDPLLIKSDDEFIALCKKYENDHTKLLVELDNFKKKINDFFDSLKKKIDNKELKIGFQKTVELLCILEEMTGNQSASEQEQKQDKPNKPQFTGSNSFSFFAPPTEPKTAKALPIQTHIRKHETKADGNCALHAVLGELKDGKYECKDIKAERKKLSDAVKDCKSDDKIYDVVVDCIEALVTDKDDRLGSAIGEGIKRLRDTYQKRDVNHNFELESKWLLFESCLRGKQPQLVGYIEKTVQEYCKQHSAKKERKLDNLQRQFSFCLNNIDNAGHVLKQAITYDNDLKVLYDQYNAVAKMNFKVRDNIDRTIIEEYAAFVAKDAQYLLRVELHLIACVNNKTVKSYIVNEENLFKENDIYNDGQQEVIEVRFRGNHYERIEPNPEFVKQQNPKNNNKGGDEKNQKSGVKNASSSSPGSSLDKDGDGDVIMAADGVSTNVAKGKQPETPQLAPGM